MAAFTKRLAHLVVIEARQDPFRVLGVDAPDLEQPYSTAIAKVVAMATANGTVHERRRCAADLLQPFCFILGGFMHFFAALVTQPTDKSLCHYHTQRRGRLKVVDAPVS